MKERINRRRLIILLVSIFFFATALIGGFAYSGKPSGQPHPEKGVLNLENWRPERDGAFDLSGEWDFYWEQFLPAGEPGPIALLPDVAADVPNVWNRYKINGQNLPGFGYGTYVLRVINAPRGQPLALRVPTFSTAYEMYTDGRLTASNGVTGTNAADSSPEYLPRVVEFTPEKSDFTLMFHVSNFTYARGGMWYAIPMGTAKQILGIDKIIADKDAILFGALMVMAFYYLMLFLLRREDKSSFYFVLMCLVFAARTMIYGDFLVHRLLPFISFHAIITIDYITLCWFSILAAFMVGELFPEEANRKTLKGFAGYGGVMALIYLLTPIAFFTRLVYLTQIGAMAVGIYAIFCVAKSFLHAGKDSLTVLLGTLPVFVCALHDILYQNNVILSNVGELVPAGLFLLLLMQSFVLARRSAEAFSSVNSLSQKLLEAGQNQG